MDNKNINERIDLLDQKLDRLLEFVEMQNRKREEFDDLVKDVSIVARDAFHQTVNVLDKAEVAVDSCGISCLVIKVLQNLDTFYEMLEMLESARDFMKDFTPVMHQIGLDAVNKMNAFEQKGYFDYLRQTGRLIEKWIQVFTVEDMQRMEGSMENIAGILRNLSDPSLMAAINKASRTIATLKMDDETDNKSLWQLFRRLRSKEVRKSLSYTLRLVQAINTNE